MVHTLRTQQGFTLIELMVGLIVTTIVVAGAYTVLISTERASRANDLTVQTQQNVRTAMALLANDLKVAGFGATLPVGNCRVVVNGETLPAPLLPGDQNPAGPDTGPDRISIIVPVSNTNPPWVLDADTSTGFSQLTLKAGATAAMQTAGLVPVDATADVISIGGGSSPLTSRVSPAIRSPSPRPFRLPRAFWPIRRSICCGVLPIKSSRPRIRINSAPGMRPVSSAA